MTASYSVRLRYQKRGSNPQAGAAAGRLENGPQAEAKAVKRSGNHLRISNHVQQRDNVWASSKILQNLDLALDLLLLDRLEHFDDAFLVVNDIDALEDFAVFASPCKFESESVTPPLLVCFW